VDDFVLEIMTVFGVKQKFRLQYKDKDFGNEYMHLMSTSQIEDGYPETDFSINWWLAYKRLDLMHHSCFCSSDTLDTRDVSPCAIVSVQELIWLLFLQQRRNCFIKKNLGFSFFFWFLCSAEIQLQRANTEFSNSGMLHGSWGSE